MPNETIENLRYYSICIDKQEANYAVKEKMHQGRKHYVIPVVMMVEGVHHGNHGPLLHTITELGKFPESWNGIPVVINHPEVDGIHVSANNPDIIETAVGRVYNTHVDGARLKAEAWIDSEKLQQISAVLVDQFKKGELIEVSLGMFSEEETVSGDWNGETYEAIAKNHRPDHLALLPGAVGACSLVDGCGLGVNSDNSNINLKKEELKMAETTACTPCVKKKVDELIANSQGKYTEDDRVVLETLSETLLDRISQPVIVEKEVIKEVEKMVEVNVLSEEDKAVLDEAKNLKKERREANIKLIQDNSKDWTPEELSAMNDGVLKKIAGMVIKEAPADYSLNSAGHFQVNAKTEEEPLPMTGIVFKNK